MTKNPEARPGSLENMLDAAVIWRYFAPAGTTLEMVTRPDYWRNVTRELGQQRITGRNAWNKIEVLAEDGSWEAELRVLSVEAGLVQTRVIREWFAPVAQVSKRKGNLPDGYMVEHVSGNGWRALDPNGAVIASGKATEDDAIRAAAAHQKKAA